MTGQRVAPSPNGVMRALANFRPPKLHYLEPVLHLSERLHALSPLQLPCASDLLCGCSLTSGGLVSFSEPARAQPGTGAGTAAELVESQLGPAHEVPASARA